MITRRSMLLGLTASLIAAPAVIRTPGLLMKIVVPEHVTPGPWVIQWSDDNNSWQTETFGRYVRMAYPGFNGLNDVPSHLFVREDWPSRTIKAPPGGFKIART